jgi:hypothetical protein
MKKPEIRADNQFGKKPGPRSILSFVILSLCATGCAHVRSLELDAVSVSGTLEIEAFPGRPTYESIQAGDEVESEWILVTPAEKFQLVVVGNNSQKTDRELSRCVGQNVTVRGIVWEAETGHHHTDRLITVKTINRR